MRAVDQTGRVGEAVLMAGAGSTHQAAAGPGLLSPYAQAMHATREALVRRAAQYKWLVIVVALGGVATLAGAASLRDWRVLAAALVLPSAVLTFFALDARAMDQWRAAILKDWASAAQDLTLLAQTLRQVPGLPANTVEGMLLALPGQACADAPRALRPMLARTQARLAVLGMQRMMLHAASWTLAAGVALAACFGGVALLTAGAVLPLLLWGGCALHAAALRTLREAACDAAATAGVGREQTLACLAALDVQGLSAAQRTWWMAP